MKTIQILTTLLTLSIASQCFGAGMSQKEQEKALPQQRPAAPTRIAPKPVTIEEGAAAKSAEQKGKVITPVVQPSQGYSRRGTVEQPIVQRAAIQKQLVKPKPKVPSYRAPTKFPRLITPEDIQHLSELDKKLYTALRTYDVAQIKELLAAGANPNAEIRPESKYSAGEFYTPGFGLYTKTTIFNNFLKYLGEDLKKRAGDWGWNADARKAVELIPIFCKAGAQLDKIGQGEFLHSMAQSSVEFVEALYRCGGKISTPDYFLYMAQDATFNKHGKSLIFLQWLLDHGMNISENNFDPYYVGQTLLMRVIVWLAMTPDRFDDLYNVIKFLLERGADIGITDNRGRDVFDYIQDAREHFTDAQYKQIMNLFEEPIKKYKKAIRETGRTGAPGVFPAGISSVVAEYLVGEKPAAQAVPSAGSGPVSTAEEMPEVD